LIRAYFDSSAVFKLAKAEAESQALIDYLDDASVEVSTSILAEVEVIRNLRLYGFEADDALAGFYLVTPDEDVRRTAIALANKRVKALDAIHIATALAIGDRDLHFITYDDLQAGAARLAGLTVVQPGR
jgi:predicted nucleic acid-binding protein